MQSVYHIGYTNWNDEFWQYPQCRIYYPVYDPRLIVNISGQDMVTGGNSWSRKPLSMHLVAPTMEQGSFEVSNGGEGILEYRITWDADWLTIVPADDTKTESVNENMISAKVEDCATFKVVLQPKKMQAYINNKGVADGLQTVICVHGDNCEETADFSENDNSVNRVDITVRAEWLDTTKIEAGAFIENDGYIAIEAPHFSKSTKTDAAEYKTIDKFGKTLGGVKAFPTTNKFGVDEEAPVIEYSDYLVQ